jgi:hypothetical protein
MTRLRSTTLGIGSLVLVVLGLLLYPFATQAAEEFSARRGLQDVWKNARESGSYHFSADVTQLTLLAASAINVGR